MELEAQINEEAVRSNAVKRYAELGHKFAHKRFVEIDGYWYCADPFNGGDPKRNPKLDKYEVEHKDDFDPEVEEEKKRWLERSLDVIAPISKMLRKFGIKQECIRGVGRDDSFTTVYLTSDKDLEGDHLTKAVVIYDPYQKAVRCEGDLDAFGIPTLEHGFFRNILDLEEVDFSQSLENLNIDNVSDRIKYLKQEMDPDGLMRDKGYLVGSEMMKMWEAMSQGEISRVEVENVIKQGLMEALKTGIVDFDSKNAEDGLVVKERKFTAAVGRLRHAIYYARNNNTFSEGGNWEMINEHLVLGNKITVLVPRDMELLPIVFLGVARMAEKSSGGDEVKKMEDVKYFWERVNIVWDLNAVEREGEGIIVTGSPLDSGNSRGFDKDIDVLCKALGKKTIVVDLSEGDRYTKVNERVEQLNVVEV